ncbi:hypothetical protein CERZMDRAFT_97111 [Cercospora zeae-maydis SCOH1-5]|uniref:Uncharacterized protein n=1 Tax=Cercospora zeae-maydis SCOH1-5 TaxID=717836 RepID=A0A6A6FGU8_9PEZI|nr:hypothetical protein CERZMDRAFT_97111 [Cercospora zeae-maydis SCOH1-5]
MHPFKGFQHVLRNSAHIFQITTEDMKVTPMGFMAQQPFRKPSRKRHSPSQDAETLTRLRVRIVISIAPTRSRPDVTFCNCSVGRLIDSQALFDLSTLRMVDAGVVAMPVAYDTLSAARNSQRCCQMSISAPTNFQTTYMAQCTSNLDIFLAFAPSGSLQYAQPSALQLVPLTAYCSS